MKDAQFIRAKSKTNLFIHFDQKAKAYVAKEGTIGACVFDSKSAQKVINDSEFKNDLEMVHVSEIIKR